MVMKVVCRLVNFWEKGRLDMKRLFELNIVYYFLCVFVLYINIRYLKSR